MLEFSSTVLPAPSPYHGGTDFSWALCLPYYPVISVELLKETQSIDPDQWPDLILLHASPDS